MRSRNLKHKITFQIPIIEDSDFGGKKIIGYSEHKTVRASVENFTTKEVFFTPGAVEMSVKKFRVRYFSSLSMDMRIKHGEKYFDIVEVANPNEKNKEYIIAVKEMIDE